MREEAARKEIEALYARAATQQREWERSIERRFARENMSMRNITTRVGWHMLVCDCGCGATFANPGTILGGERRQLICKAERDRRTAEHRAEMEAYWASPEGQDELARQRAYNARPLDGDDV